MKKIASLPAAPWAPLTAACGLVLAAALAFTPHLAHADGPPKIVKKVPPEFPGEATRKGVTDGVLKAKLTIDGNGAVTEVAIVEATPAKAKIFNDAATTALNQWKFEASGKPQTFELKLVFTQE
ncbi:energy transducer TonB [Ideonella sp.]|uniref:energy transducer TonB n=1 Tax=Ideonella sp. TaxID=1929293 RepID=UPI0035B2FD5C